MMFELPPRHAVGHLDPEIAGEGEIVHQGDENLGWSAPPKKLVMPDWSEIKSIRRYFGRTGTQVWPAWVYHPSEPARILQNADEGMKLGIFYRKATIDEKGKYGIDAVWDWKEGCQWRPRPYQDAKETKFDPARPGQGKIYLAAPPNPTIAQNELIRELLPLVSAAVVTALKGGAAPAAPANVDAAQWDEFIKFQAWQKSSQALDLIAKEAPEVLAEQQAGGVLSADEERALWLDEAKRKNIKVDGRWSLEKLKQEVEKAA